MTTKMVLEIMRKYGDKVSQIWPLLLSIIEIIGEGVQLSTAEYEGMVAEKDVQEVVGIAELHGLNAAEVRGAYLKLKVLEENE